MLLQLMLLREQLCMLMVLRVMLWLEAAVCAVLLQLMLLRHEPTRHSICTHPHILHMKITKDKITPVIMHPFCFVVLQSVGFHYNIWCVYI